MIKIYLFGPAATMGQSFSKWNSRPQTAHPSFKGPLFAFLGGLSSSAVLGATGRFIPARPALEDDGTFGIAEGNLDAVEGLLPFTVFSVDCLEPVGFKGVALETEVV